jgi:hypothetical protein
MVFGPRPITLTARFFFLAAKEGRDEAGYKNL